MKPLFTKKDLENAKPNDQLPCECYQCTKIFYEFPKEIRKAINNHQTVKIKFCSRDCMYKNRITLVNINCHQCNKLFQQHPNQIKKSKNNFCSRSCSATYNNKHKSHGTRRSKVEKYFEEQLTFLYPKINISYNKIEAINAELDIYIPSLKLAFELNGIFHYKPIYGAKKLLQTQNTDKLKLQSCIENNISLNKYN